MTMLKTRLLQAVCAVAMLAAVPALAQRPEAGMTGPNGVPNPAAKQPNAASGGTSANTGDMAPANGGGATSSTSMDSHATHRMAMTPGAMHGRTDTSQDAAVDRLNDQSYQAAQQGQAFGSNGPGMSAMPPGGSGSASDMSGGSMPSNAPSGSNVRP
jgi:hypothetical protein